MNTDYEIKDKTNLSDSIKITPFKSNIRKTSPHKHNNYFEIIYLSSGTGRHTIDMQEYRIQPPVIFIIRKEQVHFWEIDSHPEGYVMIIKKSFLDGTLDRELKQLFSNLSAYSCLFPNDKNAIEQIFQLLAKEGLINSVINGPVIEGLLKALLAKMLQSDKPRIDRNLGKENIFNHFKELLSHDDQLTNKVAYYAELLHTTPQNLNVICRKATHHSAAEIISEYIINEAKRLLIYTSSTVTEIAYTVGFKDNSHFIKYYKKHTGFTPNTYRHNSR